jgi:2-polyprenyl-3-methyl-5-hydroxy-6-metoxy-1,4-benzoquinol methylase
VPSSKRVIAIITEIAARQRPRKAVDLGAGDGRILFHLALQGIEVHGYEINPLLVWWGKWRLRNAKLHHKAFLKTANLWKQNIEPFDLVIIYGLPNVMGHFERKLERELKPGARVISNSFPLPTWKPIEKIENVYLYVR